MGETMDLKLIEVDTKKCGKLKVFIQGDLTEEEHGKAFFISVHDMGTNHKTMVSFVNRLEMKEVKEKSVFLHVCLPGQEDNAPDNPKDFSFPSMQEMGEDLSFVLDAVKIGTCFAMGDGAGANIVCRFAMKDPKRVTGVILLNPTSTTAGALEYIKDKVLMGTGPGKIGRNAQEYLISHKFGKDQDEDKEHIRAYLRDLNERINPLNLKQYVNSFLKRTDLSSILAAQLKKRALLVVGSQASHLHTIETMHRAMAREKSECLKVDGVGDVMTEAPEELSRSLILFCLGCGFLGGVTIPGMERSKTPLSMIQD